MTDLLDTDKISDKNRLFLGNLNLYNLKDKIKIFYNYVNRN